MKFKEVYVDCILKEREKGYEITLYVRNKGEIIGRLFYGSKSISDFTPKWMFTSKYNGDYLFNEFYFMKYEVDLPNIQFNYLKLLSIHCIQPYKGFLGISCSAKIGFEIYE